MIKISSLRLWWLPPEIPALGKLRQEDCKNQASLGYIVSPISRKKTEREREREGKTERNKERRKEEKDRSMMATSLGGLDWEAAPGNLW
jgi:hypothetical protein